MNKLFFIFFIILTGGYSETGLEIVKMANKYIGKPYVYGGNSLTKGIDCSAFVKTIIKEKSGIALPRTAKNQAINTKRCSDVHLLSSLRLGDAIYFKNKKGKIHHVALVTGFDAKDGYPFITHAKGEEWGVVREKMSDNYRQEFYIGKRFTSCKNKIFKTLLIKNL